jgi:hypothetical protein
MIIFRPLKTLGTSELLLVNTQGKRMGFTFTRYSVPEEEVFMNDWLMNERMNE